MTRAETDISGPSEFPSTVWSRLLAGEDARASLEYLARHYWKPAYLYIRRRWRKGHDDALDLTQEFFAVAIESDLLSKAEPARGSFRRFLRASIENFLKNDYRNSRTQKRGGGAVPMSIDALENPDVLVAREGDPEQLFDREWLEAVFTASIPRMKESYAKEGKAEYFEIFRRYELERPLAGGITYEDLAKDLALSVDDVRNRLTHARGRWRKLIMDELRESTGSPEALQQELQALFPK